MIVDSSAVMAMLLVEPDAPRFVAALVGAHSRRLSGGSWIELSAVLTRRPGRNLHPSLNDLMVEFAITIEPVTVAQSQIAHEAYRIFGIGSGHPARLNFGDCFAYALAKETGEPLLFKGDDFIHTDVAAAA